MNDLRFAFRQLLKNPGFTAVAVLTLALGIGANTAVFSLINELLLRPLQVKQATELLGIVLMDRTGDYARQRIPFPVCRDYREQSRAFSQLFAWAEVQAPIQIGEQPRSDVIQLVSANFFTALGVIPVLGRTFSPEDDLSAGQGATAVISHRCWQDWFGCDSAVIGRTMIVRPNYAPPLVCTIVGVAPAGFAGLERRSPQVWLTAVMEEHFKKSQPVNFRLAGFLAANMSRRQAIAELDIIAGNIAKKYNGAVIPGYGNEGIFRSDLKTELRPAARGSWGAFRPHRALRQATVLAMAVGGLVLLIVCANVSNLLLARATQRRKEMAIRLSIGASRWQLLRQTLTECLVLALLGGVVGLLVARWTNQLLLAIKPADVPFVVQTTFDYRVVCFALLVSILAGFVFGTAPAWQATGCDLNSVLKDEGTTAAKGRRFQLRDILVVTQIALCLLLLIGAGLCLRSFAELTAADPGFNTKETVVLPLQMKGYTEKSVGPFFQEMVERLEALPGVRSVTYALTFPLLGGGGMSVPVDRIQDYTPEKDEFLNLEFTKVGPKYFETMGIPVLQAPATDAHRNDWLVWINESFARRYWPGQAPVGKRIGAYTVGGIVRDSHIKKLTDQPEPHFYLQRFWPDSTSLILIARTDGNTRAAMPALRQELQRLDKNLDLSRIKTTRQVLSDSFAHQRFLSLLLGGFALSALILAALGIYGVMSYRVTLRTREIGIRIALGAQPRNVLGLVLRHGALLTLAGILIGIACALVTTRVLASVLYETSPTDPLTFAVISWLLVGVALLACWLPARRATRVDPMVALRYE